MRVKTHRRIAATIAGTAAALLALTGCTGSVETDPASPFRGFDRVGELDSGLTVWHAHGSETGSTNVIIADGNLRVLSCLGEPRVICYDDERATGQLVTVIAPEGTERIVVDFAGEEVELGAMSDPTSFDDPAVVFAGQMPAWDGEGFSWKFIGYDAAGEELWTT